MLVTNNRNHDPLYGEFLKGKKVALVGPAPHILGSKQKDIIDSYDLVARIGKAFKMPEEISEDAGTKIDILYNVLNDSDGSRAAGILDPDKLKDQIKWMCSSNGHFLKCRMREAVFIRKNQGKVPFHTIDREYHKGIQQQIGGWLNSGFVAILDLLYYDIVELYITGITFFSEKDDNYYIPHYRNPHLYVEGCYDTHAQLKYMKKLYKEDNRIKPDKVLKKILEEK